MWAKRNYLGILEIDKEKHFISFSEDGLSATMLHIVKKYEKIKTNKE